MAVGSHCKDPRTTAQPHSCPCPDQWQKQIGGVPGHLEAIQNLQQDSPRFLAPPPCHWPPQPTCSDSGFSLSLIPSLSSLLPDSGLWSLLAPVPPPHGGSRMGFRPAGLTPSQRCPWVPFLYSIQGKRCVSYDPLPDPPTLQPPHTPCPSPQPHTCIRASAAEALPATRGHTATPLHMLLFLLPAGPLPPSPGKLLSV